MGRGRAKAKQTKVARALKYGGPQTDLERLQAELSGSTGTARESADTVESDDDADYVDPYADVDYDSDDEGDDRRAG